MTKINPYLSFNDNCEDAFDFYKSVFGGEFTSKMKFKDVAAQYPVSKEEGEKIMHMALPIGKTGVLMGSDTPAQMGKQIVGTNITISLHPESEKEADRLFKGLSAGGTVVMPLAKVFWGAYFGLFTDKFGIPWMINYEYPKK